MLSVSLQKEQMGRLRKWLCRDRGNRLYLLAPDHPEGAGQGFQLHVSRSKMVRSLDDFETHVRLLGDGGLFRNSEAVDAAGIQIDGKNRLCLAWGTPTGRIELTCLPLDPSKKPEAVGRAAEWKNPFTGKAGAATVCPGRGALADLAVDAGGTLWVAWLRGADSRARTIMLSRIGEKNRAPIAVHGPSGGFLPALAFDRKGGFHLVWNDILEDLFSLSGRVDELGRRKRWSAKKLLDRARDPVWAELPEKVFAVYENDWSFLEYIFPDEKKPERQFLSWPDPRFTWDVCRAPRMVVDRHGVPWVFFIEETRKHVFFTRWLETSWAPIQNGFKLTVCRPRMVDSLLSVDRLAVGPGATEQSIGALLVHEQGRAESHFQSLAVPSLAADRGKTVLFLDLLEIAEWDNVVLKLTEAEKHRGNPVIEEGGPKDFDAHGAGGFLSVLKEDGRYRMWYGGTHIERETYWTNWCRTGYAESRDGYRFQKIPLGLAAYGAKKRTNIIPGLPYVPHIYRDVHDPDPRRRYKMLGFPTGYNVTLDHRAGRVDPWGDLRKGQLHVSADGIHWKSQTVEVFFPEGRNCIDFVPQSFFFDPWESDSRKKYKCYGFLALNLSRRAGGYAYSPDAIHWTIHPDNPVLDPYARGIPVLRSGKKEQIHDLVVWPYEGYYLALYHYQHSGERLDIELAASRDGERFFYVCPGQKLIPNGGERAWDEAMVSPSIPLVDGKEIRLYYGGISKWITEADAKGCPTRMHEIRRCGGLATVRRGGFTSLQPKDPKAEGSFTTIPIQRGTASALRLNAQTGKSGAIEMEVLDPRTRRAFPGFTRRDCVPFRGDSLAHAVRWKGGTGLALPPARTFRIRFHFSGAGEGLRLYSFGFQ